MSTVIPSTAATPEFNVELLHLVRLSLPTIFGFLLQNLVNVIAMVYIGLIDNPDALSAAGLAFLFASVTGFAVVFGLASCLDTLASQAFGAKDFVLFGNIMQRGCVFLNICSLPSIVIWVYCSQLLLVMKQDAHVAQMAGEFILYLIPGFIATVQVEVLKRGMFAQKIMHLYPISLVIANIFQLLFCYVFIFKLNLGLIGAAIATSISNVASLLVILFLVVRGGYHEQTWKGVMNFRDLFSEWDLLARFAIPAMLMYCLEQWFFEVCAFMAGAIDRVSLDAFIISMNLNSLITSIPVAISVSVATTVGNNLGAKNPVFAKKSAHISMIFGFFVLLVNALVCFSVRDYIGKILSSDVLVISKISSLQPFISVFIVCYLFLYFWSLQLFDGFQMITSGVLRGSGNQKLAVAANLVSYYFVSLPIVYTLAFICDWGLMGVWIGMSVGVIFASSVFLIFISRISWEKCMVFDSSVELQATIVIPPLTGIDIVVPSTEEITSPNVEVA